MKIVIESPEKLTDSDLEKIVDVWNRKGRRMLCKLCTSLHKHTLTAHAHCETLINNNNEFYSAAPPPPPPPLPPTK